MAESIFNDKSKVPTSLELDKALGKTSVFLKHIEQHLSDRLGAITREWKFYSKKASWTLALVCKDRRVLYLIPRSGLFTVVFTLGKQAVSASRNGDLPPEILSAIENAHE
jgi:hypothetical protein